MMADGWLAERTDCPRNIVHVTPINDRVEHDRESFGACVCKPRCVFTGSGWLFTHASLDGRELAEV